MEKQSPCILRKSPDLLSPRHSHTCTPEPIQLPIRFFKTSFSVQQMAMEWMEWGIASSMFPLENNQKLRYFSDFQTQCWGLPALVSSSSHHDAAGQIEPQNTTTHMSRTRTSVPTRGQQVTIYLTISLSIYLSTYLPTYLSVYLSNLI